MNEQLPTHESATRRSPLRRWLVVGLLILLALAALAYWHLNQDAAWHEAVAEADRQDPNWRLNDILDTLPRPRDADNSAAVVVRVTGLIPAQWPDPETAKALSNLLPEHLLDEDQLKRVREELAKTQPALTAARTLADMPHGRHPIRYQRDVMSTLLPTVQESRRVTELLQYDILLRLQENDPEGALVACRAILNAGRSLGDEPIIICQLIRMAIQGMAQRQLERVLAQGQVSEPSLAQMQKLLEEEEGHRVLLVAARGERGTLPHILQYLESGERSLNESIAFYSAMRGEKASRLQVLSYRIMPGQVRTEFGHLLQLANRWVEVARLPVEEQLAAVRELEAQEKELPPLARSLAPAVGKITHVCLRRHAETRCAVAALAAERYRLKHGRWPDKLDQLVPEFLTKPLLDPFDPGAPGLRLKRTEDGLIFYSVGPDGRDDGGLLEHRTTGQKTKDTGFQLWNPDRRRQPPRPRDEAPEDKR